MWDGCWGERATRGQPRTEYYGAICTQSHAGGAGERCASAVCRRPFQKRPKGELAGTSNRVGCAGFTASRHRDAGLPLSGRAELRIDRLCRRGRNRDPLALARSVRSRCSDPRKRPWLRHQAGQWWYNARFMDSAHEGLQKLGAAQGDAPSPIGQPRRPAKAVDRRRAWREYTRQPSMRWQSGGRPCLKDQVHRSQRQGHRPL